MLVEEQSSLRLEFERHHLNVFSTTKMTTAVIIMKRNRRTETLVMYLTDMILAYVMHHSV